MIGGGVECGPERGARVPPRGLPAHATSSLRDLWERATYRGFWKMARRFWRVGLHEMYRSLSTARVLARAAEADPRSRVPRPRAAPGPAFARRRSAPDGKLVDDFFIRRGATRMIHVLNAPSPAATASIAIGRSIAEMAVKVSE